MNLTCAFAAAVLTLVWSPFAHAGGEAHASTGGFADRNLGLNGVGGPLGASIFY